MELRSSLAHGLHSHSALTCSLHGHMAARASRKEHLSLFVLPPWWCTSLCILVLSHPGARYHVAPAARWPMAMQILHAGSRRKPEMDSCWEQQDELPRWRVIPLSSCLWTPKDCALKWSRNSGHGPLSWPCWGHGCTFLMAEREGIVFVAGVCHTPRSHIT